MNRRLIIVAIGSVLLVGTTGVWMATAQRNQGPVLIAGDQPVTEEQVRQKLQSEGYLNVQIVRQGRYFEAMGTKDEHTSRIIVDSQTGRLASERRHGEDDDDDDD